MSYARQIKGGPGITVQYRGPATSPGQGSMGSPAEIAMLNSGDQTSSIRVGNAAADENAHGVLQGHHYRGDANPRQLREIRESYCSDSYWGRIQTIAKQLTKNQRRN